MLRKFLATALVGLTALTTACRAEVKPSEPAVRTELKSIIEQQLAAFRADDYAAAYAFAHPGIQAQFAASEFAKMVRAQYPQIASSTGAEFLSIIDDGAKAAVAVKVTGTDGGTIEYQYLLELDGSDWRIAGVIETGTTDPAPVEI